MLDPIIIELFLSEWFTLKRTNRVPEPLMTMDSETQVQQYLDATHSSVELNTTHLFHAIEISKTIQNCNTVADLACGPAAVLTLVAKLNPQIKFTGIDFSPTMRKIAIDNICKQKLESQITIMSGNITKLQEVPTHNFDGVISTLALHHLPTIEELHLCFSEISRILKPNGSVYLTDFLRLNSSKSMNLLANKDPSLNSIFKEDYLNSLKASFSYQEFKNASLNLPTNIDVIATLLNLMVVLKTKSHPLNENSYTLCNDALSTLSKKHKRIFNSLKFIFKKKIGNLV